MKVTVAYTCYKEIELEIDDKFSCLADPNFPLSIEQSTIEYEFLRDISKQIMAQDETFDEIDHVYNEIDEIIYE